jgi:CheY-like chemotaxis protein
MSADLLKLRSGSEEYRALLDVVATSAERGAGLVAQMLSFSRGLDGDREVVDLANLVKELGRFIGRTFAKSIRVRLEIAPDLWRLYANPTQVYQVLLNLCVNARDAMPGGGQLTLTAGNVFLDGPAARALPGGVVGSYAVLGVSDTGTGIAPENVGRIFAPFFTTKPVGEGTGLGLSTVQSIITACGGFITLSTQIGQGTTFHVYFPVSALAAEATVGRPVLANARGNGEHVLVVDDEAFFCNVTRRLLEDFGYIVHVAADGAEAVQIFKQHSADIAVAVVDLDMPVMDGRTAIRAFRAVNPRVRIIAVSGSGGGLVFAAGDRIDLQLKKPYSMGTLLQALRQVLAAPVAA